MKLHELLNLTFCQIRISNTKHIGMYGGDVRTLKCLDLWERIWDCEVISITTNETNNVGRISILIKEE